MIKPTNYLSTRSFPVTCSSRVLNWIIEPDQMMLTFNIVKEMRDTFGSCVKVVKGESKLFLWQLECRGISYNIYTGAGTGTSIEVIGIKYEELNNYEDEIIEFLKELIVKLKLNKDEIK